MKFCLTEIMNFVIYCIMDIKAIFQLLKDHAGSHKAAAKYIGMSYTRYNEWRWNPDSIPGPGRRLLELAAKTLSK